MRAIDGPNRRYHSQQLGASPNRQQVLALGPEAERMGYDSVWVMDHLFNTGYIRERLEDRPYYHPMAMLSHMSATTSRVTLATSVLVLPYHNPVELAKYAATLDQMSARAGYIGRGRRRDDRGIRSAGHPYGAARSADQ